MRRGNATEEANEVEEKMEGETITGNTPGKRLSKYTVSVRGRVLDPTGSEIALPVLWLSYKIVVQRVTVKRNREH